METTQAVLEAEDVSEFDARGFGKIYEAWKRWQKSVHDKAGYIKVNSKGIMPVYDLLYMMSNQPGPFMRDDIANWLHRASCRKCSEASAEYVIATRYAGSKAMAQLERTYKIKRRPAAKPCSSGKAAKLRSLERVKQLMRYMGISLWMVALDGQLDQTTYMVVENPRHWLRVLSRLLDSKRRLFRIRMRKVEGERGTGGQYLRTELDMSQRGSADWRTSHARYLGVSQATHCSAFGYERLSNEPERVAAKQAES